MSISAPAEQGESVEEVKQRLLEIVAGDFRDKFKDVSAIPDREIFRRIADQDFNCPIIDFASLQMIGSVGSIEAVNQWFREEFDLVEKAGHILRVHTNYKHMPQFLLLVLAVEKSDLTGRVKERVRSLMKLGVRNAWALTVHDVDMTELLEAVREG